MKMDEKGFSLVELLAIIVITSVIIVPLMTTFVNLFEINNRMHDRRNAVGIADTVTNSINRFPFLEIKDELDLSTDHFMMLTMDDNNTEIITDDHCNFSFSNADIRLMCDTMFSLPYNNMVMAPGNLVIYFIDYNLNTEEHIALTGDTSTLPPEVQDAISQMPINDAAADIAFIMRYVVYAQYSDDPRGVIILDGVFIND